MSKSLSLATVVEKNRLSSEVPFLLCAEIDVVNPANRSVVETLRVVRNSENITFGGNVFTATEFSVELKSESGTQASVNMTVTDFTLALQSRMQTYGGGIGFDVRIIVLNAGNLTGPAEIVEYFTVIAATSANYIATFTLGAENTLTRTFPRRRQTKDFCQWRYKGAECGYSGALETCDLTLQGANGCAAHNNTARFGAYPGIAGGRWYG